jgi:hypothetical protein
MSDTSNDTENGRHWFRLLLLIALAIGAVAAGRSWAMSKADKEFEQRLRLADERRD